MEMASRVVGVTVVEKEEAMAAAARAPVRVVAEELLL